MFTSDSDDSANSVATSVALLLPTLQTLYKQNLDRMIQPFGTSGGQSTLLVLLSRRDGSLQKDLARQLGVKAPSLTTMLNRMERAGLLERRKSDSDQRATRVYLTDKGRRASKRINAVVRFLNERNLAGFRNEEKILLLRLLEHMSMNMKKQRDELAMINMDELMRRRNIEEYEDDDQVYAPEDDV